MTRSVGLYRSHMASTHPTKRSRETSRDKMEKELLTAVMNEGITAVVKLLINNNRELVKRIEQLEENLEELSSRTDEHIEECDGDHGIFEGQLEELEDGQKKLENVVDDLQSRVDA